MNYVKTFEAFRKRVSESLSDEQIADLRKLFNSEFSGYSKSDFVNILNSPVRFNQYIRPYLLGERGNYIDWITLRMLDETTSGICRFKEVIKHYLRGISGVHKRPHEQARSSSGTNAEVNLMNKVFLRSPGINSKIVNTKFNLTVKKDGKKMRILDIVKNVNDISNNIGSYTFEANLNKHDIEITLPSGTKKIEVKKYDESRIFGKSIMLAELYKIADRLPLKKIVDLYNEVNTTDKVFTNISSLDVLTDAIRDVTNDDSNKVRNFFNDRIKKFFDVISLNMDDVQKDVFGVYFFNEEDPTGGFLLKKEELRYHTTIDMPKAWLGFFRFTFWVDIPGEDDVHPMVWGGKDFIDREEAINTGMVFDEDMGYWVARDN